MNGKWNDVKVKVRKGVDEIKFTKLGTTWE